MGRDVVFGLEPGEFADDLGGAERLAGVGRKTVAGDVVLDAGDVAAERCVAILEGETGGQAFEDFDVAAETSAQRLTPACIGWSREVRLATVSVMTKSARRAMA